MALDLPQFSTVSCVYLWWLIIAVTLQTACWGQMGSLTTSPPSCSSPQRENGPTVCHQTECFNGYCELAPDEDYPSIFDFVCTCDRGWQGASCDLCCDLDCGNDAECALDESESESSMYCLFNGTSLSNQTLSPTSCTSTSRNDTIGYCLGTIPCHNGECTDVGDMFICDCDPGWAGDLCNMCCDLDCVNGKCVPDHYGVPRHCACWDNYTHSGILCDIYDPDPTVAAKTVRESTPDAVWYATGFAAGLICVLLILLVAIPYYMYRHRYTICLRIIYYFKSPEDEDDKLQDVTISCFEGEPGYGLSNDGKFARDVLVPMLQNKMKLKVCLPFDDFEVGAHNIYDAITSSRRIVLLISPDYVKDEWARLSYQIAQQEMLKLRSRIVPILLNDISDIPDVDRNLLHIMNTINYLEWPMDGDSKKEANFWRKLRLCMPKKKKTTSSTSHQEDGQTDLEMGGINSEIDLISVEMKGI